jgi:O-antigen/teichoic acid export membrane protein
MQFPAEWITSIVIAAYCFGIFYFLLAFNQFADDRKNFALLHILQASFSLALMSALVLVGTEWKGAILGKIAGLAVCIVVGVLWLTPKLDKANLIKPRAAYAKQLVRFGWIYLPTGLGAVLAGLTDRLIIAHVMGVEHASYYGIAELFGSVLTLAVSGFIYGWMPWLFRHLSEHGNRDTAQVGVVSLVYFLLIPVGGWCVYGVSVVVGPYIVGDRFQGALDLIPFAIAVMVLRGYFVHNQAFLLFKNKVGAMSISSIVFVVLNIALSFVLIYPYGIVGVFVATCLSYFVATLLNGVWALRSYRES